MVFTSIHFFMPLVQMFAGNIVLWLERNHVYQAGSPDSPGVHMLVSNDGMVGLSFSVVSAGGALLHTLMHSWYSHVCRRQ